MMPTEMLLAPVVVRGLFSYLDLISCDLPLSQLYGYGHNLISDELRKIQSNNVATQGNENMNHSNFNICEGQKFVFRAPLENSALLRKKKISETFLIISRHIDLIYFCINTVTSIKLA